jgi:hypothetical protein
MGSNHLPQGFEQRVLSTKLYPLQKSTVRHPPPAHSVATQLKTSNSSVSETSTSPPPPAFHPTTSPANPHSLQPFNISNLTPSVPELTPTNSRENLCDFSSSASQSDDFASLHSTGNHKLSKRPAIKPPAAPVEPLLSNLGFSSLHGGRATPNSLGTTDSDTNTDISAIISLQERLCSGLSGGNVRRSVVLSCGQPLCEAAVSLLQSQPPYLPASKKFKFSEKLNSVQHELRQILVNPDHSNDGKKLARLCTELVKMLK